MIYTKYFKAVNRHKYFVFLECCKMAFKTRTPKLIWRGITHDLSKLTPAEFFPYAKFFYGKPHDTTKYYSPSEEGDLGFNEAWFLHQNRNSHHWQWYILLFDDGGMEALPMEPIDRMEMLCDWAGAGKAYENASCVKDWYSSNKDNMILSDETRDWVEAHI